MQKNEKSKNLNQNFFINLNTSGENNSFGKLKKINVTINNNNNNNNNINNIINNTNKLKFNSINNINYKSKTNKNLISPSKLNENNLTNFTKSLFSNEKKNEKNKLNFFVKKTKSTFYKQKNNDDDEDSNRMFIKNKNTKNDCLTLINQNNQINNIDINKNERKVSKNIFSTIQRKINSKSQQNKINNRLNDILKKYFNVNEDSEIINNDEISTPKSPFKIFSRNSLDVLSQSNLLSNKNNNSYFQSENSSIL